MSADAENRYRTALGAQLPGLRSQAESARTVFDTIQSALTAGAWVSTVADSFAVTCESQERAAQGDADECVQIAEQRYHREPVKVEATDRRARW